MIHASPAYQSTICIEIKKKYNDVSWDNVESNLKIKEADVIDFSFSRTKIEDVYTKIEFKYNWDYARGVFSDSIIADLHYVIPDYKYSYYGFKDPVYIDNTNPYEWDHDSTLVIDDDRGKYIRSYTTAKEFADWYLLWSCNQHLKIKVKLPLKYMDLEVGDIIGFDAILGDIEPYGIDYTKNQSVNEQNIYISVCNNLHFKGDRPCKN